MKTNLFIYTFSTLITVAFFLTGCSESEQAKTTKTKSPNTNTTATLAVAHWVKGDPVDISSGVHVVEFWATWCPPCRTSIPHLTKLQEKYLDQGVNIIGVSKEKLGTVEPFVEKMGDKMAYTVAIDSGTLSRDYMEKYNIGGIPHAFFLKDSEVVWNGHPMDKLEAAIENALK
ncbi:MAG: TlpA disulfide reductase family protein [Verrucomicrobiota bacterium]|nr:TlpA disulfide reductase family protein [Verrucomicrobiota bacterium]